MFSTSPLDWGLILLYFGFLAAVWAGALRRRAGALEYLVAGRRITLPALVATLVATWYGGILGVGEYSWRHGLANWLVFGVPYYVGALLFAFVFARRAREARLYTLPDLLDQAYGRGPALMGALAVFVAAQPAAYVLMLGTLFAAMTGLPLAPCILAAAVLSLFYVDRGGLRAVVLTDQVQFVLMYAGFALLLAFLVAQHGAWGFLRAHLPPAHLTWHGGNAPQAILVWYFIALSALVDPGFWQRAYAARDPRVARNAVLWSVACWAVFDAMTTIAGLYARALLPDLRDPVFAFPELARIALPPFALGQPSRIDCCPAVDFGGQFAQCVAQPCLLLVDIFSGQCLRCQDSGDQAQGLRGRQFERLDFSLCALQDDADIGQFGFAQLQAQRCEFAIRTLLLEFSFTFGARQPVIG